MTELSFDGRVAVVTGAGGGLGREYALLLASRGARVVVNDLGGSVDGSGSGGAAESVVAEIRDAGGTATANTDSVTDPDGVRRIVETAVGEFGALDILINNAGILRDRSFHKQTMESIDAVLDVHLRGTFMVTLAAWPVMRAAGYGRVVNTSSNSGLIGNFGQSNYGAAKTGIVGFTRVLAIEGANAGIQVNAIAPAARTRMTESLVDDEFSKVLDPAQVAPAVAWLAHEDCPTTGEVISAGGGRVARYFIGLTPGWFSRDVTPEGVRDNWEQARSLDDFIVPTSPTEEADMIMRNWS